MELSIILVSFNDKTRLGACLGSLRGGPPQAGHEILVVDNASSDGSREMLGEKYPGVRLIANSENVGFAKANNRGAAESRGELLLFLNTDTIVPPGAIEAMIGRLRENPAAAAVGPGLIRGREAFQVSFGKSVSVWGQFRQKVILNPFYARALKRKPAARTVGWLSAACLLCRRAAFEAVGGFDERFFIYFEDIDLCYRLRSVGWTLLFAPGIRIFHEGGATTLPRRAASRYEYRRSQLHFYRKHNSPFSYRFLRLYLKLWLAGQSARGAFKGEDGAARRERYRELLKISRGPE